MNKVYYNVSGMANNNDKTKMKNALDKVVGVQLTEIDMARGTVEIGYNDPANEHEIKYCIEKTGYKVF